MLLTDNGEYGRLCLDVIELRVDHVAADQLGPIVLKDFHGPVGVGGPATEGAGNGLGLDACRSGHRPVVHDPLDGRRRVRVGSEAFEGDHVAYPGLGGPIEVQRRWGN